MNKRIILSAVIGLSLSSAVFSQTKMTSTQYLEQYKDFVNAVSNRSDISKSNFNSIDSVYEDYTSKYKIYKSSMTTKQIEEYNELKSIYRKRIIKYRAERFGEKAESTSDSVGSGVGKGIGTAEKGIKRTGATVGGFVKGIFKSKSDAKTEKK